MCIIAPIRLNDIDKRCAGGIAEPVHLLPGPEIFRSGASALRILVHLFRIQAAGCRLSRQECPFRILGQKRVRKAVIADNAYRGKKDQEQQE